MKQEPVIILEDENGEMEVIIRYVGKGNFEVVRTQKKVNLEDFANILENLKIKTK